MDFIKANKQYLPLFPLRPFPLLIYEWGFSLLLGFLVVKLMLTISITGRAQVHFQLIVILVFFILLQGIMSVLTREASNLRWRIRLAYYPLLANMLYFLLGAIVPLIHPVYQDQLLQSWDRLLIGYDPSLLLQGMITTWLNELMSVCYLFFFFYLITACIRYILWIELTRACSFLVGLSVIYIVGFIGYCFLPALGPYDVMKSHYTVALNAGPITRFTMTLVTLGSNHVDEFPSLHCAISTYILLFDRKYNRKWFYGCIIPVVGLWFATVYLRFHYLVDVIAGLTLALSGFIGSRYYCICNRTVS